MLRRSIVFLACLLPLLAPAADLPALIQKLEDAAVGEPSVTKNEQKIAAEIQKVGARAIPALLTLLNHPKPEVRSLAGYTLRDIEGLNSEHTDALIAGFQRGAKWLPPAIARTGNPKAAQFLIEEYLRTREIQSQLDWSIELLGEKAVMPLVAAFRAERKWDVQLDSAVMHIFGKLGPKARIGVPALVEVAKDLRISEEARSAALRAIGAIGHDAGEAAPLLEEMRQAISKPVRNAAEDALIAIGSQKGMVLLLGRFERDPDETYLRAIAEHGERAKTIGPEVASYLEHEDWDVRLGAARALGFIGYDGAAAPLIAALASPEDWRLAWAAAESLGRLKITAAKDALEAAAKGHWYSPVREASETALKAIGADNPYAKGDQNFASVFYGHWDLGRDWEAPEETELTRVRLPKVKQENEVIVSRRRPTDEAGNVELFDGIRVSDGEIVGSNNGEWGGKLIHIGRTKETRELAPVNTHAIYGSDKGAVALTGLAHLGMNNGIAYKVERDPSGQWTARKWRALPGAPRYSHPLQDGSILAVCVSGAVVISPDGTMKQLTRAELLDR